MRILQHGGAGGASAHAFFFAVPTVETIRYSTHYAFPFLLVSIDVGGPLVNLPGMVTREVHQGTSYYEMLVFLKDLLVTECGSPFYLVSILLPSRCEWLPALALSRLRRSRWFCKEVAPDARCASGATSLQPEASASGARTQPERRRRPHLPL